MFKYEQTNSLAIKLIENVYIINLSKKLYEFAKGIDYIKKVNFLFIKMLKL